MNSGNIPVYGTGGYMLSVNDKLSDADAVGIGRKGTIDKPLYLRAPFWTVDTLFYCTSKENSDVKFIYLLFQIINWKRYDESTGVPSLSKNTISSIKTYVPKVKEQDHISKLFFSLDNTLQLHERKCEELALIKKALLQKLFPKKDEIKPEVRYKNFSDAWEQRKLGETSKITAGGDVNKEKLLTHGKFPVIANALTNNGIVGYYNDYYRIAAPAVTVTGRGEIGKAKSRKINFTPVVRLLAVESKHNVDFLAEAINRSKVVFESTGVPQLTVPKLSNYKISFPNSVDEETKIGDFLQQFDTLIALHQRKLEKLKQLKKFLLQNMFI
ncbi:restriction endonuclease subunit S [Ligilactobacillus salivarius]|uniref:restriction endonuclease subunit S n=1 Tax=Ligilactobacillus salivarius TaxID=1624 RepID=UPI0021E70639|nr:restriction endonuclease subunit S [Ligilactobacillus salivarius]